MRKLKRSDYLITLCGKVFSPNKELKQCLSGSHGYPTVNILGSTTLVHRLVAETYLPNPEGKRTVNHKNGVITDNRVCNLEWATYSENSEHSYKELDRTPSRGRMLIDDNVAKEILELKGTMYQKDIADLYGVKRSLVADIHSGRREILGGRR